MKKKPIYMSLYFQVIVAIIIGILLGHYYYSVDILHKAGYVPTGANGKPMLMEHITGFGELMQPLGTGFIKLIKMVIAPIIFCTIVSGIAGMENMKEVGKTGGIALLYFEVVSTVALVVGLVIVNLVQPGVGMNIDPTSLNVDALSNMGITVSGGMAEVKAPTMVQFLMNIIPKTVVSAFADGDILQVLFFSIIFAFALQKLGIRGKLMLSFIDSFAHVMFNVVNMIMKLAPIGAFGAMAFTIGRYGVGTLLQLGQLMLCFYATCFFFVLVVLGSIARYNGFSILKLLRLIRDELLIVLGTSSSESVLPRMLKKMELVGCHKSVVGLVIPTGYSFNLDGTSIYLTMAAIFVAQATNANITLWDQIVLLAILLISSKGAAGVTGSGFIILAATLSVLGGRVPVEGLVLILGIDRFMSEMRALTNLVGNALATVVVAKFVNQINMEKFHESLKNPAKVDEMMAE
ncbi:MAG: dicarboxylate/amino acid:cation symporter [Saezia sp.]